MSPWIDVATLTSSKPKHLGLAVRCTASLSFLLKEGMDVWFVPPVLDAPRSARISRIVSIDGARGVVEFDSVDSPECADMLVGCHVLVRRDDIPEEALDGGDELVGFEVHDRTLGFIGRVTGLADNPAHPLLQVESEDRREAVLIPCVDAFIVSIDEQARRIDVDAPAGLLEL